MFRSIQLGLSFNKSESQESAKNNMKKFREIEERRWRENYYPKVNIKLTTEKFAVLAAWRQDTLRSRNEVIKGWLACGNSLNEYWRLVRENSVQILFRKVERIVSPNEKIALLKYVITWPLFAAHMRGFFGDTNTVKMIREKITEIESLSITGKNPDSEINEVKDELKLLNVTCVLETASKITDLKSRNLLITAWLACGNKLNNDGWKRLRDDSTKILFDQVENTSCISKKIELLKTAISWPLFAAHRKGFFGDTNTVKEIRKKILKLTTYSRAQNKPTGSFNFSIYSQNANSSSAKISCSKESQPAASPRSIARKN